MGCDFNYNQSEAVVVILEKTADGIIRVIGEKTIKNPQITWQEKIWGKK